MARRRFGTQLYGRTLTFAEYRDLRMPVHELTEDVVADVDGNIGLGELVSEWALRDWWDAQPQHAGRRDVYVSIGNNNPNNRNNIYIRIFEKA